MDRVCIYLRKSRQDEEIEHITGDTLAHHRKELLRFAKLHGHNIIKIHEEVVSGDSIFHRPEMVELLKEVERKLYDAVLVMDIDRLGRGDLQDQGIILNTFKKAGTIIITPDKTYDLDNELDEQFTELKAFVSRQEYRMITKRLKAGQRRYVEEGNYIPPIPPYGYKIVRTDHDRTLEIYPEQAEVVKLVYDMFLNGTGINQIARDLTSMGYKSYYGDKIERSWVAKTLRNPIYCGNIAWSRKEIKKSDKISGKRTSINRPKEKQLIVKGKHKAIIDDNTFNRVQEKLLSEYAVPVKKNNTIVNPLAGLIKCKQCGYAMRLQFITDKYERRYNSLKCGSFCGVAAAPLYLVEQQVLHTLYEWCNEYMAEFHSFKEDRSSKTVKIYDKKITSAQKTLSDLNKQKTKLHELLEKGIYDIPTYLERSRIIADDITNTESLIKSLNEEKSQSELSKYSMADLIPKIQYIRKYYDLATPEQKNKLLKGVIKRIYYSKEKNAPPDGFTLEIIPLI